MVLATAVTWPIYFGILIPKHLAYLETIVFILVIAVLVQFIEIVLKRYIPSLYNALGVYLPLITTNCAVLGVTMLVLDKQAANPTAYGYAQALMNAFGAGIGFLVAMVIFSGVRERIELNDVPKFWKGLPITLVAASLVSVSFLGFQGLVTGMLG
jgi:electron transport complex protein RnfA